MPCNFITMAKTYQQINERIKNGEAVVLTAEEVSQLALTMSPEEIADKVDVVTTGTFGAMCSSGAFINFGHSDPPIRMERIELNGVGVSGGLAAVDTYIGATDCNPANPEYGGAHIIEDFINGKDILLEAWGKGTDCYPRRHIRTYINRDTVNEAYLYNPRNAYQNYNVATNTSDRTIHTYMGTLLPKMKNASYSTSGELVRAFLAETYTLLKGRENFFHRMNLHLIQADNAIRQDILIHNEDELIHAMNHFELRGGGGTDFRPAFAYVDRLCAEKKFSNLRGLLYFTDGMGTYPAKRPAYDTAFLFLGERFDDANVPPWAMKVVLDEEEFTGEAARSASALSEALAEEDDLYRDLNNS